MRGSPTAAPTSSEASRRGDGGLAIALQSFAYSRPGIELALASPTTISVKDGIARFDKTTLKTGGGSVTLSGQAGSTLDLSATLTSVPAALANSFVPNLGAEGTISGTVMREGRRRRAERDVRSDARRRLGRGVAERRPWPARRHRQGQRSRTRS